MKMFEKNSKLKNIIDERYKKYSIEHTPSIISYSEDEQFVEIAIFQLEKPIYIITYDKGKIITKKDEFINYMCIGKVSKTVKVTEFIKLDDLYDFLEKIKINFS